MYGGEDDDPFRGGAKRLLDSHEESNTEAQHLEQYVNQPAAYEEKTLSSFMPTEREEPTYDAKPVTQMNSAPTDEPVDTDAAATTYVRAFANDGPRYRSPCARIFIFVFAGILMLAGIGVAALGRIEIDHHVLPLCPSCEKFAVILYVFGSCLAVFGLCGIGAAFARFKPFAFAYAFILFLLSIGFFAAAIAFAVFDLGLTGGEVRKVWVDAVGAEQSFICDFQDDATCSGFDFCCLTEQQVIVNDDGTSNETTVSMCTKSNGLRPTMAEWAVQCDTRCTTTNQEYVVPCNAQVTDLVKSHFKPLIGVTLGLWIILTLAAIMAVRMSLKEKVARPGLRDS